MPAFPWTPIHAIPFKCFNFFQNVMYDSFKTNLKTGKSITIDGDK